LAATYLLTLSSSDWPAMSFINKFWDEAVKLAPELKEAPLKDRLLLLKSLKQPKAMKVRLMLAEKAGSEAIFGSKSQIVRDVQTSWLGCNLSLISGSEGHHTDLLIPEENVIQNRARTISVEVRARMAEALGPLGLDTPLQMTGPSGFPDGVDVIINHGGFQEEKEPMRLIADLASHYKKNVVFMHPITREKMVFLYQEGKQVIIPFAQAKVENLFWYYDPAATRGTNFVLPQNAHAAVFLSPTATAAQMEQAVFRLRDLGAGHTIELFVSEAVGKKIGENPTAGMFLDHVDATTEKSERTLNTLSAMRMVYAEGQKSALEGAAKLAGEQLQNGRVPVNDTRFAACAAGIKKEFVKTAGEPPMPAPTISTPLQKRAMALQKEYGMEDERGAQGAVEKETTVTTTQSQQAELKQEAEVSSDKAMARQVASAIKKGEYDLVGHVTAFVSKARYPDPNEQIPLLKGTPYKVDFRLHVNPGITYATPKDMDQPAIVAEAFFKVLPEKTEGKQLTYRVMPMADALLWTSERFAWQGTKGYHFRIIALVGDRRLEAGTSFGEVADELRPKEYKFGHAAGEGAEAICEEIKTTL